MIVLTAANSNTCQAIIPHLLARANGQKIKGLVTRDSSAAAVRALGIEPVFGSFDDPDSLRQAFSGASKVFHVCPPLNENEELYGERVVAACRSSGVGHLVFMSVIMSHLEAPPFHPPKMRVERAIYKSGVPYTVLQPTNNMQNTDWLWQDIIQQGIFHFPYSTTQPISWVDREDLAEAAAVALTSDHLIGGTFEICGPDRGLTRERMCDILSNVLGRSVQARKVSFEEHTKLPFWKTFSPKQLTWLKSMFDDMDRYGFDVGSPIALRAILGREPASYRDYVIRTAPEKLRLHAA